MKHLIAFRKRFQLAPKADLSSISVAVESTQESFNIGNAYFSELTFSIEAEDFKFQVLCNLIGRVFEHVQGMLVAMATGSPASAEALGRTVVEGSINIIYLALRGSPNTALHFLRTWVAEHHRRLNEWEDFIKMDEGSEDVLTMIASRRSVTDLYQSVTTSIEEQCNLASPEKHDQWPSKLSDRFNAVGRKTDYFESYHRLSGASHLTGEDTLHFLIAANSKPSDALKFSKEAWAYSIMMTRISSIFFVDAVEAVLVSQGRTKNVDLDEIRKQLEKSVHEIARSAGVPLTQD